VGKFNLHRINFMDETDYLVEQERIMTLRELLKHRTPIERKRWV
jgi:hypothetical protein